MFRSCFFKVAVVLSLVSIHAQSQETTPPSPPAPKEWTATAGFSAIINSGNSTSQNVGGNALVSRKWDKNQMAFTGLGAYGRAKDVSSGTTTTNTKNWKTTLRYDRFFTEPLSIFNTAHAGQDKPAGFDWRYGDSLGLSRIIVQTDPTLLKCEAGYDFTREQQVTGVDIDIHSGRAFFQYKYKISTSALFGQDVESLFNIKQGKDVRINSLTSLTMKLTDKLSFQTGFGVRFDNQPVPGFKKVDTTTQAGLVLSFL